MAQTLGEFIAKTGIRFVARQTDSNPHIEDRKWANDASHWRCTLIGPSHKRMIVIFSQGSALRKPPSAEDVIGCVVSDSAGIENARDFEDWCMEYGYETDSRSAEKTFKECKRRAASLKRILGTDALYQELLFD